MDDVTLLNMDTVDMLREMDEGSGFFAELVHEFAQQSQRLLHEIEEATNTHDQTRLEFAVHTLKGSSFNVGADEQAQLCHQIEVAAAQDDFPQIAALVVRLKATQAKTDAHLAALV